MATPKQGLAVGTTATININSNYQASPPNQTVGAGQTLEFKNQASEDCYIYFNPVGVITPIVNTQVPAGGSASIAIPFPLSETVDYVVLKPDGSSVGPYSVTVNDNEPLPMTVDSSGNCQPGDAAIPAQGWIYFNYSGTQGMVVTFQYDDPGNPVFHDANGNAVTSQNLSPGVNPGLQAQGSPQTVSYTIAPSDAISGKLKDGGGTIKVGSS